MATYSNIGIKLITTGDESGTWGTSTNENFSDVLDEAIAGAITYNISSDADFTLTVSDGTSSDARHAVIKFTSTTLTATRVCTFAPNDLQKTWVVINSTTGGQSLTFKQGSAGGTVTVPNGESAIIYSDGGGASAGAITRVLDSFTNTKITTGTLNATTLDLTNLEVTNVKAKDGTAAITIADSTGKVTVSTELAVDNLNLSGNTITSTDTNGNIDLTPNGTGEVNITKVDIDSGAIDGTPIGANSASTGAFTTLSASGNLTLNGGTANGVLYLNGSKVATSGSALTFDGGANLSTGGSNAGTYNTLNVNNTSATGYSRLLFNIGSAGANGIGSIKYAPGIFFAIGTDSDASSTPMTFNLNGSEQMRLTSTGLGIGTSSPAVKLDVAGASTTQVRVQMSGQADVRLLSDTGTGITGTYSNHPFTIKTNSADVMSLTAAGNVGIGTSSPTTKLHVQGGQVSDGGITYNQQLTSTAAYNASPMTGSFVSLQYNSGGSYAGMGGWAVAKENATDGNYSGYFSIFTRANAGSTTERFRIDSSGNLGLGVTPSAWASCTALQIRNASLWGIGGSPTFSSMGGNDFYDGAYKYISSAQATDYYQFEGAHAWRTAASGTAGNAISFTTAMLLSASGNLGLGVTPSAWGSSAKAIQFSGGGALWSAGNVQLGHNVYSVPGTNEYYIANGAASRYYQSAGAHVWDTAASGTAGNTITFTQAMTLDASGRLGIGQTSPNVSLHIENSSSIVKVFSSGNNAAYAVHQSNGNGKLFYIGQDNSTGASFGVGGYSSVLWNDGAYPIVFATNNTERARITSGGDFLVGTTSSTASARGEFFKSSGSTTLRVKSTIANAEAVYFSASNNDSRYADLGIYKHSGITNSAAYLALYKEDGGASYLWTGNDNNFRISTAAGDIGTNGGTVVGTQTSDERVKNIVGPVQYGLNEVLALQPIAFAMKDTPETKKVGFSAQQVQGVIPEAVYDTGECIDGYDVDPENKMLQTPKSDRTKLAMEYTQIIPVLVNAVKELKAELDAAKAEIAALKGA